MRLRLLTLAAAISLVAGCPGIGDVDRTQPDRVEKTIFKNADGTPKEFYYRQTVIDVPATSGVTFIGEQGDTERVTFEVTENFLYAYRSYGWLQNVEGGAVDDEQGDGYVRPGTGPYQGAPLAAFAIKSHFDIKRAYNPSTGEQTNVIVEDGSDRPWYDRDYIRVDWSTNQIADFRFGSSTALQTPASRNIPEADDNPENVRERPVVTGSYIDIVTEYNVEPEALDFRAYGYGMIPECYFYSSIYKDCLGGTIKMRSSFREVTPSDYMPQDYDDVRFQKFGFFRTERYRYDDQYGVNEPSQIRLANRWNLWTDAQGCYDADADLPYSGCDPSQLKTIVYYLNEDFPRDIPEMTAQALDNGEKWNDLFKEAVKASTGWNDADIGDHRLFTLCANNPVQKGDPAECGDVGTNPQIGDLRFSMYYYVPNFQYSPPLGYGPSASDPLTGELIAGNAFYYGAAGATIAARTLDILKIELNILQPDDISDGLPAREAFTRSGAAIEERTLRNRGRDIGEKARRMASNLKIDQKAERLRRNIDSGVAFHDNRDSRIVALKNSGLDELAMTDEIKEVFAGHLLSEGVAIDDADAVIAARLFDDDMLFARAKERQNRLLMAPGKTCILSAEDVFDDGLLGMLRTVRTRFYELSPTLNDKGEQFFVLKTGFTEQQVYNFMLSQTMGDTQLHEVGHTVGLRHNFSGSTDALNYGVAYWEARGGVRNATDPRPIPEWEISAEGADRDAMDIAIESGLRDNQETSIMDYASTYGTSTTLGSYDLAAIKYAYGDVVEVFNNQDINKERAKLLGAGEVHYTWYPEIVSNGATFEDRIAAMYDRSNVNFRKVKRLDDVVDGDQIEVPYSFCSDEYRDASATCAIWDQGADNFERTQYAIDHYRHYRVFNAFKRERLTFGVDIFSYLSRVYSVDYTYILNQYKNWVNDELIIRDGKPCLVMDGGQVVVESDNRFAANSCGLAGFLATVDTVNLMAEVIESPDVGCYARLKPGCYDTVVGNGSTSRPPENDDLRLVNADPNFCDTFEPTQPPAADINTDRRIALKINGTTAFSHVPDSLSCDGTPDGIVNPIGVDAYRPPAVVDLAGLPIADAFIVTELAPDLQVRAANTLYDRDRYGYYFYIKPTVIGSWWEKWLAVKAIGDGNTDFIGVDASSDARSFLISLNTLFGNDLNNLIGASVTDNVGRYGPVLKTDGTLAVLPLLDVNTGGAFDRSASTDAPLNPDQQYTFRLLAMFNAAYNGQATDDFEFGEAIWVGTQLNVTDINIPPAIRADPTLYAEVTDPVTGLHYYTVKQVRSGADGFYSTAYDFIREIKSKYYVGGADGDGTTLLPGYQGTFEFEPRQDLEVLQIMGSTARTFGYADVWSGDLDL
ncbi:MAG: hypothetical protein Q8O67_33185 [Deltaproteobacteria bacterium]|nr:hypothetical protein [Deltaproteobacteria bacterium]